MTPSDVKIVAENINDFIEVSDGINRLRKEVLTLAVSGGFSHAGSESWNVIKLGEICSVKKGKKPELFETQEEGMLPYLEARFIRGTKSAKFAHDSDKNSVVVDTDDLIIICDGSNSGEFFAGVSGVLASTMGVLAFNKEIVLKGYLELFLQCNFDLFNKTRKGAAIPHLDLKLFNSLEFSLPSIEEQDRIVEKVNSVMKQLDELESHKYVRDQVRARLVRSAMQSLGSINSKIALEQLPELIKTTEDVKEFQNAIRTLGVLGKLVLQDKKDKCVEGGGSNQFTEHFSVPQSWKWFQLNDICNFKYGYTDSAKETGEVRFVRITDMDPNGNLIEGEQKFVDLNVESEKFLLRKGDILTARTGATYGRTIKYDGDYKAIFASYLIRIDFDHSLVLPEYYLAFSLSGLYWNQARSLVSGSAQPQFNANLIRKMYIPIPPINEQKRIVKKIEELTKFINHLKMVINNN